MSYEGRKNINAEYTVVSHNSLSNKHTITLKASGLKDILKRVKSDEDLIHLSNWRGIDEDGESTGCYSMIEISHYKEK